jgi:hypothetical protein
MLGLCLVAVLAVAAVAASSALAVVKNPTHSWKIWDNCPVNGEAHGVRDLSCVFGATEVNEGGQFTVGPITVPLVKQIVLQYGLTETPLEPEIFVPPAHGAEAISATPEKVPGEPIAHVTPAEQQELGWPETLQYSYAQAQKHHSVRTAYETIELAGVPVTHIENIVNEEGIGLEAPVKIKAENKWLAELGDVCYVGSNAEPIVQHLTAATSESPLTHEIIHGFRGEFEIQEGPRVVLTHSNLVDNTYAVPAATCTGPYSSVIAATINKEFGLPEPAGASVTEIKGTLYSVSAARAEEHGANGA